MSFESQVRERLEAICAGKTPPDEVTGATSVRCAVGLVLGSLDGLTTLSEGYAWEYLDRPNRVLVRELRAEYFQKIVAYNRRVQPAATGLR